MAHQNVFRTREGGGSKTSCNPKPTDHFPGTVQNLPTRSRKAVTEVRAAQNEGGS